MKRLLRILFSFTFILTVFFAGAQQIPNSNQYLINRYLLSPSYAGYMGESQVFIGYRNDWSGFQDAPQTSLISAYVPVSNKVWLGAQIIADNAGIYNNIYAQFSYTYQLELGFEQNLYFGLWASLFQNKITLTDIVISDLNDPLLIGQSELTGFSVNAGTSLVYKWRDGYIGVTMPYLFKNKDAYALNDMQNIVELNTQIIGHISYKFRLSYDISVEPLIVYRWVQNFASQIDYSILTYYHENYWIGLTYRDIGKSGVSIGSQLTKNLIFNYTYEFVTKAFMANPSSTHEFTLGFNLPIKAEKRSLWRKNINNRRNQ